MKKEQLFDIIGEVDEQKIADAGHAMNLNKKIYFVWYKWITVACVCIIALFSITYLNMKQYVRENNITVYSSTEYIDSESGADVTPQQAECLARVNYIHNTMVAQNYEWYGNCYYDFEADKIIVGLTENSDSNKEAVLNHMGDTAVEFEQCEYSYQYLEELYDKLDEKRVILLMSGVKRYNISIEKNRVNVCLSKPDKYAAIYLANKSDNIGGAIVFTTGTVSEDGDTAS